MSTCRIDIEGVDGQLVDDANEDEGLSPNYLKPKRTVSKTERALEEERRKLKAFRATACGKLTSKSNRLKQKLQESPAKSEIKNSLEEWDNLYSELKKAHENYREQSEHMTKEEFDDLNIWSIKRYEEFDRVRNEIIIWLNCETEEGDKARKEDDNIGPRDSVSHVSGRSRGSNSSTGSSLSRAKMEAAIKRAELQSKMEALKKRQALENEILLLERKQLEENRKLQQKREQLELDAELSIEDAKLATIRDLEDEDDIEASERLSKSKDKAVTSEKEVQLIEIPYEHMTTRLNPTAAEFRLKHQPEAPRRELMSSANNDAQLNSDDEDKREFFNMLKQQNQIADQQRNMTKLLMEQQVKAMLPQRIIKTYTGDPVEYMSFIRAFEYGIEDKTSCSKDRLYYLEQFTTGEPNTLVRSCMHMEPEAGYREAKRLLVKRFGNKHKIAEAFIARIQSWPEVKSENAEALSSFSIFLRECFNTMKNLDYMHEMDHIGNIQLLVSKLPFKLRERWRIQVDNLQEDKGQVIKYVNLLDFVERQARILSNPMFGMLGGLPEQRGFTRKTNPKSQNRSRGTSFAVNSSSTESGKREPAEKRADIEVQCLFCTEKDHLLPTCKHLLERSWEERLGYFKQKGLCFGCAKTAGHRAKDCKKRLTCEVCQRRHPTVLHKNEWTSKETDVKKVAEASAGDTLEPVKKDCGFTECAVDIESTQAIVPVIVRSSVDGSTAKTYAFLDSGSNAVFCSKDLMKQLNMKGKRTKLQIQTMIGDKVADSLVLTGLEIMGLEGENVLQLPKAYVQDKIPASRDDIPTQAEIDKWGYLKEVNIRNLDLVTDIGLLIGINVPKASEPWKVINSQNHGPYACLTRFGWAVYGLPKGNKEGKQCTTRASANKIVVASIEEEICRLFNQDFNENPARERPENSVEDCKFLQKMNKSCKQVDGHYELSLPLRKSDEELKLPNNKPLAEIRLGHLKKRLYRNASLYEDYMQSMKTTIESGFAELVPDESLDRDDGRVWYVPHHGVRHPQKQKLRVVFDCAAEYKGRCINKELLQGPDMTSTLVGVLSRFRENQVAVMADVQNMFCQVKVPENDRDLLRFLWWPDGKLNEPAKEYRMATHVFGATSSPACACFALRKAGEEFAETDSKVANAINRSFYVDDCLQSLPTEEEAIKFVKDLTMACSQGGFHLTKFVSNSRRVLESIDEHERSKDLGCIDLDKDVLPTERALGMLWSVEADAFKYAIKMRDKPLTRRGILSTVSGIYDPLGLVAPAILPGRLVFQDLCRLRLDWDQELPHEQASSWKKWINQITSLEALEVHRCIKPPDCEVLRSLQLHHFSDASQVGYGTVSYLRLEDILGNVSCSLLMAKSRVAPLKQVSIPRLELTAAVVATRVNKMLLRELTLPIDETYYWTDSMTVLRYIRNESARFHTFVANRVSVIREESNPEQWFYVPTKENPADDCSRGVTVERFLSDERWFNGPPFLHLPKTEWPAEEMKTHDIEADPEVKRVAIAVVEEDRLDSLIQHYSCWYRLKKAVAWLLKIKQVLQKKVQAKGDGTIQNLKDAKCKKSKEVLSVQDLESAEIAIMQYTQNRYFKEEIEALKKEGFVKKASTLGRLDPVLANEVLRVGGRLGRADVPLEARHPMILPKDSHVTRLILEEIHERTGHSGRNYMLSYLHRKYWVISANSAARKIINKCVICKKQRAHPVEQKMADLVQGRVKSEEPPFSRVGIDYFGPIEVKLGRSRVKRYGVLFTCLAVRAIHLEKADSLDTDSCIDAIRRFIARRGPVKELRSDNGTNLVGAEREMRQEMERWNKEKLHESMLRKGIQWIFNPPSGSHCGGVWERQIKTVRKLMYSITNQQTLTDESLQTLFCEVEYIVNSRPITTVSGEADDLLALTPNDIIQMKEVEAPFVTEETGYIKRRWRQVQYLAGVFWRRWTNGYLPLLQARQKWKKYKRNVKVGDVVLVVDNSIPRNTWLMGKVIKTMPDKKGIVRQVNVKTKQSVLLRPVQKLIMLLECDEG